MQRKEAMSISTRSERKTEFIEQRTPANVGPGLYDLVQDEKVMPSYAGFMSSGERKLNEVKGGNTPGPGRYNIGVVPSGAGEGVVERPASQGRAFGVT